MNRPSWKTLVFGVVIAIALFAVVDQANACCGAAVAAYGPFPAYAAWDSCGGCGFGGCGWYGGYWRPFRHGCGSRWYGGCYAGYGCCYPEVYSGCYATYSVGCCGTVSSCCGGDVYVGATTPSGVQPTPAVPTPARKPIEAPAAPNGAPTPAAPGNESPNLPGTGAPSTMVTPANSGMLTVWVPYDAKVTINGMATKSIGSRRQFVSYDLKDGFSYKYEVKAEIVRDGKIVEDTKTVVITAGSENSVAFGFNMSPAEGLASK